MNTLSLKKFLWGAAIVACFISGCGSFQKIETADDLAQALKRNGVKFDSVEAIDLPVIRYAKFDEGISLRGEGTQIEIFRIEDPRTFEIMAATGPLLAALGERIDGESALQSVATNLFIADKSCAVSVMFCRDRR